MSFKRQVDGSYLDSEGGWFIMRERVFERGRGLGKTYKMMWALYATPTRTSDGKYRLLAHYRTLGEAKKVAGASGAPWLGARAAQRAVGRRVQPWEAPPLRAEDIVYGPRYLGTNRGFRLPDGSVQGSGFFVVTKAGWVYLGNPDADPDEPPYEFEIVRVWSPQEWSREPGALEIMQAFARTEGPGALALPHLLGGTGSRAEDPRVAEIRHHWNAYERLKREQGVQIPQRYENPDIMVHAYIARSLEARRQGKDSSKLDAAIRELQQGIALGSKHWLPVDSRIGVRPTWAGRLATRWGRLNRPRIR